MTKQKKTNESKKSLGKTSSKTNAKKQIEIKSIGQNLIAIIDNQKYSRRVPEKQDRLDMIEEVRKYNVRNSIKRQKDIIKFFEEPSAKIKAKKKVTAKTKKPSVSKDKKPRKSVSVSKKTASKVSKAATEKPKAKVGTRRKGEY
jgi:hypothetical protein